MPHFFVDRSLGRIRVPAGLRSAGWELTTLAEHYGIPADEGVADVEWLTLCGRMGWAILMKDDRIRRRPAEAAALTQARVPAFCIGNANLPNEAMINLLMTHERRIIELCGEPPALYVINRSGLRALSLSPRAEDA